MHILLTLNTCPLTHKMNSFLSMCWRLEYKTLALLYIYISGKNELYCTNSHVIVLICTLCVIIDLNHVAMFICVLIRQPLHLLEHSPCLNYITLLPLSTWMWYLTYNSPNMHWFKVRTLVVTMKARLHIIDL